jgi:hypothetical protein
MAMMYRTSAIVTLLTVLFVIVVDLVVRALWHRRFEVNGMRRTASRWPRLLRGFANLLGLACFAAVAGTALLTLLTKDTTLTGYRLMVHVSAAAAFAPASIALALLWTHRNRFTLSDWSHLRHPLGSEEFAGTYAVVARKAFFWIAVALCVPTILSITAAMFTLFGPREQQYLFLVHRYCALSLVCAGVLFAYFAIVSWQEHSAE